jgi:6-phosphofructokinase
LKVHYIFVLKDMMDRHPIECPQTIDGNMTPRFAWQCGYLSALEAVLEAFKNAEEKSSLQ